MPQPRKTSTGQRGSRPEGTTSSDAGHALFGELATLLQPRALPLGRSYLSLARDPWPEPLAFALDVAALAPELRRLEDLPGARLGPFLPIDFNARDGDPAAALLLGCDAQGLRERAACSPIAELLWCTWENLQRRPRTPEIMGVLNVTPDSFSDGGQYLRPELAVERALEMRAQGADWIDVGGESTRPGAEPVREGQELARILPVVEALCEAGDVRVSVDTSKAEVAREALAAGAHMINDVRAGLGDPQMLPLMAEHGVPFVLMHHQGEPRTMQQDPKYGDVVADVSRFLRERVAACLEAGIELQRLWVDPGIGFGKRLRHNLSLLRRLPELRGLGLPLALGVSRKSFIGHIAGQEEQRDWKSAPSEDGPSRRLGGTAAALFACVRGGAELLRVHDVDVMREAAQVAVAVSRVDWEDGEDACPS